MKGRLAVLGPRGSSELELLQEYFHILTLRDLRLYRKAMASIQAHPQELRLLFETVGLVDAAVSTLSFRATLPAWCPLRFRQATHWNVPAYSTRCSTNLWQTVENWKRMCCLPAPTPRGNPPFSRHWR